MKHMSRNMEISIYLAAKHMARYMEISMVVQNGFVMLNTNSLMDRYNQNFSFASLKMVSKNAQFTTRCGNFCYEVTIAIPQPLKSTVNFRVMRL